MNFFQTIKSVKNLLDPKAKKTAFGIVFFTALGSLIDVLGLAAILPIIFAALKPEVLENNSLLAQIVDFLPFSNSVHQLIFLMLLVLLVFILKNIYAIWIQKTQAKFAYSMAVHFSEIVLNKMLNLPLLDFQKYESGEIVSHSMSIPDMFSRNILMGLAYLISEFFVFTFILLALLAYNPILFLILLISLLPIFYLFYRFNQKRAKDFGKERNSIQEKITQNLIQLIGGIIDIKLLNKSNFISKKIISYRTKISKINTNLEVMNLIPIRLIELVAVFGISIIFIYALQISDSKSELLVFLSLYATAAYRIMPSSNRILNGLLKLKTFNYTINILKDAKENQILKSEIHEEINFQFQSLEIKNLNFKYENQNELLLKNINLKIIKGDQIGIVGTSGEGKTTLLQILLRFLENHTGEFLINGKKIDSSEKFAYQNQCAYVQQQVFIWEDTIAQNIAFGIPVNKINFKKVEEVIHQAALKKWIDSLELGILTKIEEAGKNISGGQKQRLALARALYRNAEILVLDEATTSLDSKTENEIIETINDLSKLGKTIIWVSHNPKTLRNCNKIYKLEKGKIN